MCLSLDEQVCVAVWTQGTGSSDGVLGLVKEGGDSLLGEVRDEGRGAPFCIWGPGWFE
jgi:hypothetical protein